MCYVGLNLQKHFRIIGNEISLHMLFENKVPNLIWDRQLPNFTEPLPRITNFRATFPEPLRGLLMI